MNRLIIADIKSSQNNSGHSQGHYIPVAKNYLKVFGKHCSVVAGGPVYRQYFKESELLLLPYSITNDSVVSKLKTFINSIVLFWRARGNIIVLQQSTAVTSFVAIALFYWCTSELYLIQYNTEALNSRLKRFIYYFARWKIKGFICPNEHVGDAFRCPYFIAPDYFFTESDMPEMKPYTDRKYDLGILGTIHRNKGVIEAACKLKDTPCKVLIAGKAADDTIKHELESIVSESTNIELNLDYISEEKYREYIKDSRYCLLNYYGTYLDRSSGVVLDIIHQGTPVIGHKCIALKLVADYNMGFLYENIEDLNVNTLLHENVFNEYCNHLKNYLKLQKEYIANFISFVFKK